MRYLKLANKTGYANAIDLTTNNVIFFHSISGLGFEMDETYRSIGNRYSVVKSKPKATNITGSLAFLTEDPYSLYFQFLDFIEDGPLVLYYSTHDDDETQYYAKNVTITSLSKGEINQLGYLECQVSFFPLTPWYRSNSYYYEHQEIGRSPFIWPDESESPIRPFWDDVPPGHVWFIDSSMQMVFESESNQDCPAKLEIYGPINSPAWDHYVNGVRVGTGIVNVQVPENYKLVIDNTTIPYSITVQTKEGVFYRDAYPLSDFTTERFITVKKGTNTIAVSSSGVAEVDLRVEALQYYVSV